MSKDNIKELDSYDFGFTVVDETEIKTDEVQKANEQININNNKLKQIEKLVFNLVNKLLENPDKDYIYWPNREKVLNEYRNKIIEIINQK